MGRFAGRSRYRTRRASAARATGLLVGAALALACAEEPDVYSVRGQVVRFDNGGRELVVDHEDVPGFMNAMRMTLPLQDPAAAESLSPGDKIRFELYVSRGTGSIGKIDPLPPDTELQLD